MRAYCFFIVFILASLNSSAQEALIEMNDRAFSTFVENRKQAGPGYYNGRVIYIKEQSLYDNTIDKSLQNMLLNSRSYEITQLVKKAKKNKRREFIGFAAIPLGMAAAACIRTNNLNSSLTRPLGIIFLSASVSCIIISPIASHRKNANYKEAVKMYNLRF